MKELLIIPITKAQLYFSKVAVVILMSVGLCLITFLLCVVGGLIAGGFPDLNAQTCLLYTSGQGTDGKWRVQETQSPVWLSLG